MKNLLVIFSLASAPCLLAGNIEKYDIQVTSEDVSLFISARYSKTTPHLLDAMTQVLQKTINSPVHSSGKENVYIYHQCTTGKARFELVNGEYTYVPPSDNVTTLTYPNFFGAPLIKNSGLSNDQWIAAIKEELDQTSGQH